MEIYVALKVIWGILLGILLMALGVMVGMDMGVGVLLRLVGKTDVERRTALNIIGPHWDGNQVWFVLGGGLIFAAFPTLYATSFSVFYVVMILLLFSMILRPVAFEYRSKVDAQHWRESWDWVFLVSGALPMIIYGAAIGNILQGVGFHYSWDGQYYQDESFFSYLLNPFAILCGLMALSLAVYQGGTMLMIRGEEPIYSRARFYATIGGLSAPVLFAIGGLWVTHINGFVLSPSVAPGMAANPMTGQGVTVQSGAWLNHYHAHPILWLAPALGFFGMLVGVAALRAHLNRLGWWLGALAWIGTIGTVGLSMFPFLLPSSTAPNESLTIWNATGSAYGLGWILLFTLVFVPTIMCYTSWCYYVMRGKVKSEDVANDPHSY